jgi:hypothetical protein
MDMDKNKENATKMKNTLYTKGKKMAAVVIGVLLIAFLIINNLSSPPKREVNDELEVNEHWDRPPRAEISMRYATFEEALEVVTDVVVVQYIESRPFGESLREFEFEVSERVLGDAANRIFVYVDTSILYSVTGRDIITYWPGNLTFDSDTEYLLPLERIVRPYANTHDDGFKFVDNIVIDLDDPSNSTMYNESLAPHSRRLNFNNQPSRSRIISRVERLTRRNPPADDFIRSEDMEDIINGSPYVLIVEINEPESLSSGESDWMSTDSYYVTLVEALKGDINMENITGVTFFADTVSPGGQHIVAVEPMSEGSSWFDFTSRNSLFSMDQLYEIIALINSD